MAQAPIAGPTVWKTTRPQAMQLAALSDGTNTFYPNQFLKIASGNLAPCVVGETTAVYGLSVDSSNTATTEPYASPFGQNHNVIGLQETTFVVNTMAADAGLVGTGTSSALTIGGVYGLGIFNTAAGTTIQGLNVNNTTATFFRVAGFHPSDATTDLNARVIVSVINQQTSVS